MAALPVIPEKVLVLLPRLASDADGEVVATARQIGKQLKAAGTDWHDLVSRLGRVPRHASDEPRSWGELAGWCAARSSSLSPKEAKFVRDMVDRSVLGGTPTEKQGAWLRAIFAKLKEADQ